MKKATILLLCSAMICSVFAQRNHDKRYNNYPVYQNNNYRGNEKARLIQRINAEYNFKINQVNNNWTLKRGQKKRAIKQLEKQRKFEIRQVNAHYNDYGYNNKRHNGRYNNRYDRARNDRNDNDRDD